MGFTNLTLGTFLMKGHRFGHRCRSGNEVMSTELSIMVRRLVTYKKNTKASVGQAQWSRGNIYVLTIGHYWGQGRNAMEVGRVQWRQKI